MGRVDKEIPNTMSGFVELHKEALEAVDQFKTVTEE